MSLYPDCTPTLTRAELAAPFLAAPPDDEPLAGPTRIYTEWLGPRWWEIDPSSGEIIDLGFVADCGPADRIDDDVGVIADDAPDCLLATSEV